MWDKLYSFAYDATIGLLKIYQKKILEYVKLTISAVYLQVLKVVRQHVWLLLLTVFAAMLMAVTVVVVPVALILVAPWSSGLKAFYIAVLGLIYAGTVVACLQNVFSEERWMKASGFQDLMDALNAGE